MKQFSIIFLTLVLTFSAPSFSHATFKFTEPQIAAIMEVLRCFGVPDDTISLVDKKFRTEVGHAAVAESVVATSTVPSSKTATTSSATPTEAAPPTSPQVVIGGSIPSSGAPEPQNASPTLSLAGSEIETIAVGESWTDPGVHAGDAEDGDLSNKVTISGLVNTLLAGTYTLMYTVSDSDGASAEAKRVVIVESPPPLSADKQDPAYPLASAGEAASFSISSGESDIRFMDVTIDPLHVYVGDEQTLTVTLSSEDSVTAVTATTQLDTQTLVLDLEKVSEDVQKGVETWSTKWTVFDTHVKTYRTTFTATNTVGESNTITLAWSDPCSGITQGKSSSLSANCAVSAVSGLDGASLTIPSGKTLTLNSGAQWVWNPGKTITVNGAIAVNGTASMKKGYLFYSGSTNDSANTSSMVYDSSSTKSGYTRAATHFSFSGSSVTGAELGTYYYSNTVTVAGIANGTTVSLSGTSSLKQMSINGGSWVTSGTIDNGQSLRLRQVSSASGLTQTTVKATIGSVHSIFSVVTKYDDPSCGDYIC